MANTDLVFEIVQAKCIGCGNCREVCPWDAIVHTWEPGGSFLTKLIVLPQNCTGCGGPGKAPCEVFCPVPECVIPVPRELPTR